MRDPQGIQQEKSFLESHLNNLKNSRYKLESILTDDEGEFLYSQDQSKELQLLGIMCEIDEVEKDMKKL